MKSQVLHTKLNIAEMGFYFLDESRPYFGLAMSTPGAQAMALAPGRLWSNITVTSPVLRAFFSDRRFMNLGPATERSFLDTSVRSGARYTRQSTCKNIRKT